MELNGSKVVGSFLSFSIVTNSELKSIRYSYLIFSGRVFEEKHNYIIGDFTLINNDKHKFSCLNRMEMLFTGLLSFHIPRNQNY